MRSMQRPGGTAGGTTGFTKIPSSAMAFQNPRQRSMSPTTMGMMGDSDWPVSKPSSSKPCLRKRAFSQSRWNRSGSSAMTSRAPSTAAQLAGEAEAENMNGRAKCMR